MVKGDTKTYARTQTRYTKGIYLYVKNLAKIEGVSLNSGIMLAIEKGMSHDELVASRSVTAADLIERTGERIIGKSTNENIMKGKGE